VTDDPFSLNTTTELKNNGEKTKTNPLSMPQSVQAVRWVEEYRW